VDIGYYPNGGASYPGGPGAGMYFSGVLDDVRLYSGALSPAQVLRLYLDSALLGHWKFDEGTGATAADSSGHGHTGTLVGGPVWTTGEIGGALAFNGSSSYVTVPSTAGLNAYPLTIAVWMKTNSTSGVVGLVNKYVAYGQNGWNLFLNSGNLCAWYYRDAADAVYPGGGCPFNVAGYNDNQWHHVVFVVDATGGTLYVDGASQGSIPWAGTPGAPTTTQPVDIGYYPNGGASYPGGPGAGMYFSGVLDDVRLYNRALSSAAVAQLYLVESRGVSP
jgi:Concanavalin A-like lectin/glucanases superfamily